METNAVAYIEAQALRAAAGLLLAVAAVLLAASCAGSPSINSSTELAPLATVSQEHA